MGGGVCGAEVNRFATLHQANGQRRSHRGFAHTAFAHDHDQAVLGQGQFIGQGGQPLSLSLSTVGGG